VGSTIYRKKNDRSGPISSTVSNLGSQNRTEISDSGGNKRFDEGGYGDTL